MTSLWLILALLIAVAMLFVLVPVWRHRDVVARSALEQRKEKNREVFEQRRLELDHDLHEGLLPADEHAKLLAELQRAFLQDMQNLESQDQAKRSWAGSRALLFMLVLLIPVASVLFYRGWGAGQDLQLPELMTRVGEAQSEEAQTAVFNELATFLQGRFERRPDDLQNGFMLGTLYLRLARYPEAISTFEAMLDIMEPNADRAAVLGQLAQAQYLQAGSMLTPEVQATIDAALEISPNEYAIMSILAADAFMREDVTAALGFWRRQMAAATPGSQEAESLRQRIAIVENYLAEQAGDGQGSDQDTAVDAGTTIEVVIDIDPELAENVGQYQSLFVYASNPASRMPILAQSLSVPEFPFTIELDNTMSMTGTTIETAPTVVVGARLSREGGALAQPGDLQTLSEPFVLSEQTEPLELVIDEIVAP